MVFMESPFLVCEVFSFWWCYCCYQICLQSMTPVFSFNLISFQRQFYNEHMYFQLSWILSFIRTDLVTSENLGESSYCMVCAFYWPKYTQFRLFFNPNFSFSCPSLWIFQELFSNSICQQSSFPSCWGWLSILTCWI